MRILAGVHKICISLEVIAGVALTFMMVLTTLDVVLKLFRMPIIGAYDLIAFACGIAISFAIPITSWLQGHVAVDFLCEKLPATIRPFWFGILRIVNGTIFFIIGLYLFRLGFDYMKTGEVCVTLRLPLAPIALGMGCACFCQCLVMIAELLKIARPGETDHE
jgi:TRAP-type C4-dicarboxylate transport system permease small subunit